MSKASIARVFVIVYTVSGFEGERKMEVRSRKPLETLRRFQRVNPKAVVVQMYDRYTKDPVDIVSA